MNLYRPLCCVGYHVRYRYRSTGPAPSDFTLTCVICGKVE